jgi:murein DD-endopeptidase MepM/ murein hydrolase activator NlpD
MSAYTVRTTLSSTLLQARRATIAIGVALLSLLVGHSPSFAGQCWRPPVAAPIADPFRQPACRWCPGNRGIEYATETGDSVTSVSAGSVSFAGSIAGVRYLVVTVANGWRITYGNLANTRFNVGDTVVAGMSVGSAAGAFHFGLRDGDQYLDPAPYLGEWWFRVRLVPTDGSRAVPSPPPSLRCRTDVPSGALEDPAGRESSLRR